MGDTSVSVLVVEDDRNIREFICEALRGEGLQVVEAGDGEEAVKCAGDRRPGAIVLDIGLPLLDGAAVADRIRDMYPDPVPVIVVTAGRHPDLSRIRASAEFTKPFDLDDLVAAVRQAVAPPPGAAERREPSTAES
ncbi:MAG: response regulator [Candidatus Limnocylindria bacterium]